jgi:hypothetical protein
MSVSLVLGLVLACAQPHPDPKTGDVVSEATQPGCVPPGGPKAVVPVAPTLSPEPEQPAVVTKPSETPRREPSPAEAANDKPVKSPTDLRS